MKKHPPRVLIALLASVATTGLLVPVKGSSLEGFADRIRAGDLGAIDEYIEVTDPRIASRALRNFYFVLHREADEHGDLSIAKVVRRSVVEIPGHAKAIGDEIRELSKHPGSARRRSSLFRTDLAGFKSDETIEVICSFLDDGDVAPEEMNDGTFMSSNRRLAVETLRRMDLPDAPPKARYTHETTEAELWKKWYENWRERKTADAGNTLGAGGAAVRPPNAAVKEAVPSAQTPDPKPLSWGWLLLALGLACVAGFAIRRAFL